MGEIDILINGAGGNSPRATTGLEQITGEVLDRQPWEGSYVVVLNHNKRLEDPVIRHALAEPRGRVVWFRTFYPRLAQRAPVVLVPTATVGSRRRCGG